MAVRPSYCPMAVSLVTGYPHVRPSLYYPETGTWTTTASVPVSFGGHTTTLLPDGMVLATGGIDSGRDDGSALAVTQFFDPRAGSWTSGQPMLEARYSGAAVMLNDGRVLVIGGVGRNGSALASTRCTTQAAEPDAQTAVRWCRSDTARTAGRRSTPERDRQRWSSGSAMSIGCHPLEKLPTCAARPDSRLTSNKRVRPATVRLANALASLAVPRLIRV